MNPFFFNLPDKLTVITETETHLFSEVSSSNIYEDITIAFSAKDNLLDVTVQADTSALRTLMLRWNIPAFEQTRILGDAWERGYGNLEWRGIKGERELPWYFIEKSAEGISAYGVKVRPSAMCFWQRDTRGITLIMDIRSGGMGVILKGRKLEAATIVVAQTAENDSFKAARNFCSLMCDDPIFPPHPVYGSNNWYYAYGESSEEEILGDTDYLMSMTADNKNPPYMVIDDCWQKLRCPEYIGGPWSECNSKFSDMKVLADKIRAKGARPGIWLRFLLNKDEAIKEEWLMKHTGCLDPTHPEALAFITEDVKRTCEWGYELIKHDFSTFDLFGRWGIEMNPFVTSDGWHFYDRSKTSAEAVKLLYTAIYEAALPYGTLILGCNTIGHLGAGLMHMNRTGDDTSGKRWERTRVMGVNTLAFRLPHHGTFYDVDADCVGIMGTIPWSLNRQWADCIAESGTSLFVSAKPGVLTAEEKEDLKAIFKKASLAEHHKIPADWEDHTTPEIWTEGGDTIVYDWYPEEGTISICNQLHYFGHLPL